MGLNSCFSAFKVVMCTYTIVLGTQTVVMYIVLGEGTPDKHGVSVVISR